MDLQTAGISNVRHLKVAQVLAFLCFALAGLLLVASLQAPRNSKSGVAAHSAATSTYFTTRTL